MKDGSSLEYIILQREVESLQEELKDTYQSLRKARKKAKRWKRKYLELKYKLDHPTSPERELGYNPYQE